MESLCLSSEKSVFQIKINLSLETEIFHLLLMTALCHDAGTYHSAKNASACHLSAGVRSLSILKKTSHLLVHFLDGVVGAGAQGLWPECFPRVQLRGELDLVLIQDASIS